MKTHPITILLIGLLIVSLTFNYAHSVANSRLRREIEYLKHKTIIVLPPTKKSSNRLDKKFEIKT